MKFTKQNKKQLIEDFKYFKYLNFPEKECKKFALRNYLINKDEAEKILNILILKN